MFKRELVQDFFSRQKKFEGIERELKIIKTNKIVSIVGPRRAGKTWYFYSLLDKVNKPMYVNFEDIAFRNISIEEFFDIIKIFSELKYKPKTLLLDEIQVLEKWETLVRSLYDRNYNIFITGSSSKLLPKEISTQLRGRTLTYILLPFSFREFIKGKKEKIDINTFEGRGAVSKLLKEYISYGSYPEVVLSKNKDRILQEYFNEIFYKDFVERHKIKSIEFGKFLFEFAFQNFSKEISVRKIKKFFGKNVSYKTLYDYIEKLQDTLVVFFVEKYSRSIYKRISWPRKIYVCDTGISKILYFSEDIGRKMENCVFLELLRKTNENPLLKIYYWKDHQQREVDFVVKQGLKIKQLIQVCYNIDDFDIKEREVKALLIASKELKCNNLLVITWDYEGEEKIKGKKIKFVPLWKWLLFFK